MDPNNIKSSLKETKEAIKSKDFEKALKLCEAILKADSSNYIAHVLLGVALQESESKCGEALVAFRKATEISSEQTLAWQGLASYYEKEVDKFYVELLSIYKQLLLLEKDSRKLKGYCEKIKTMVNKRGTAELVKYYEAFLNDKEGLYLLVTDIFYDHFSSLQDVPISYLNCYKKVLLIKIENNDEFQAKEYTRKYLNLLYRMKDYETLLITSEKIFNSESYDISLLELICDIYFKLYLNNDLKTNDFSFLNKYCDLIISKKENSLISNLVKAVILYGEKNFVACREALNNISADNLEDWRVWYLLSKVNFTMHCFNDARTGFIKTQQYLSDDASDYIKNDIENLLLEALSKSQDKEECEECVDSCTKMLSLNSYNRHFLKCLIRASIELQKWEIVELNFNEFKYNENNEDLEVVYLKALYNFRIGNLEESASLLREKICNDLPYLDYWLMLGKLNLEQNNYNDALDCFFKAVKLAPYIYTTFLNLGDFYRYVSNDFDKAKRCYQKAYQLNPYSEETGTCLSDIYRKLGYRERNFEMLDAVIASGGGKWAYLRLGLHYMDVGDTNTAINYLRSAVRIDRNDSYCWECLGDASLSRGSYTVALKCYKKCLELNPTSFYAMLQIASLKQNIGLQDESIQEYRALIQLNPTSVLALKGLAETCLKQAKELVRRQILGTARDLCEEAVTALTTVLKQTKKLSCIWKLFSDICILVCQLPIKSSYLVMSSSLFESDSRDLNCSDEVITVPRKMLLEFSLRCCFIALNLMSENRNMLNFLWHDISYCYNLQANFHNIFEEKVLLRKYAVVAAKKSISFNSKIWDHWNLLGVIALSKEINNLSLAQHCFIKSIQLENNNAISWSNLGTQYLQSSDIQLANEVFQISQRADPKYPRAWIGQALIAELVEHVETADLFYHAAMLGYHPESAKAFSEWICKILKNWETYKNNHHCYYLIKKMSALQVALTIQSWYVVHNPGDSNATNLLGILLELCGLNRSAVSVSKSALENVDDKNKDIVRSNLGRQLRKTGKYDDSIVVYQEIKEMDFITQCDLALSLFFAGQYEEALNHYESAIHWFAPNEIAAAQVMVATAALNYIHGMKDEAQTILFQCMQLKPVPVFGLFAACAFGILNSQLKLTKLVLKELELIKQNKEYIQHIALFNTYFEVFQGNSKKSISTMSKFIFNHPGDAALWISLCILLLHLIYSSESEYIGYSEAAAYHAHCAISLGKGVIDISKLSSVVSLSYLFAGKGEASLRSSMKAVFAYPDVAENWAVLIAAQYSRGGDFISLKNTICYVRKKLNCSKSLNIWLSNIERKVTNIIDF